MNQFAIGYMINPSLKFNNTFRTQVEKWFIDYFYIMTMRTIKMFLMKKNTSVMALLMNYENNLKIPKQSIEC